MPTSNNEPIQRNNEGEVIQPKPYLGSPDSREINRSMGGFESFGSKSSGRTGLSIDQLSNLANTPTNTSSFSSPISAIPRSELIANKRYDSYNRNVDLENIYGLQQSWADQLANGVVKMAGTAVGTFAQSFATIPNTIGAFRSGKFSELSGGTTGGYESSIDTWMKNIEDYFPNYYTRKEKESPYLAMLPFAPGSANFWGDKIIKNLGFTAGAIGGAIVQDLGIAAVTGGLGEIPGVAAQIGKASLWLNKIFTGTNDLEKVLDIAAKVGKSEQQILKYSKLAELAAATKVSNGFRYGMGIYGSSRTEAAIEARDSYRQVREDLIRQYKLDNYNEEPTGEAAKEIENYATDAMNTRFGINMALLTASNTIQFGNLFKSFTSASKGLSGQLTRDLEDIGKLGLKEGSKDVFEKKVAGSIGEKVWESVRPKFANVFSEGVYEEGGQYAAEKGAYDYYTRKYKNLKDPKNKESWNSVNEVVNSTMNGLKEQFGSSEGLENMVVGAISALISGGIMGKVDDVKGQGKDARLQSSINILNKYGLTGILSNTYENTLDSVGIAKGMEAAAKSGNVYDYKNLKHDMFFKFVQSRIPSQMHDVTIEQLNMLRDLDKDEFEKSFGMDFNASNKKTVNEYVDSLVNQANDIKKTYDSIDSTFKNPFKPSINPTSVQDALESNNHAIFESWKTELTQLASIAPDTNSRLASIQNSVFEINPAVSNDLLSTLSDKASLAELSKMYEEKANQLNKTVTEFTSAEDAKKIKQQVKSFRTASEKIQLGITNGLDLKSFEYLLNFELNNYDTTKERVVRPEFVSQLNDYGYDIARLKARKERASKLFDNLSDEEGFKKFFAEVEKINSQDDDEETTEAEAPVVPEVVVPQFKNKNGDLENIVPNKEYQVPTTKTAKVDKIADDRFQVTSPDGNITFYPSKEKADAAAAELNEEFGNLQKVKVIAVNDNGTVKVEDINGDIYDVLASKLEGYERLQTEQEKLQKFSEDVDKSQKEIETKSGVVGTSPLPVDLSALVKEDPKRSLANLFTGTTSVSENDPALLKAHEIRSIALKHNAKSFPNRQALRILLVTQNQEKSLGLDGLANLSMGSVGTHTDIDNDLVAAIYVEQDKDDVYFINENGERIGKLNEPVDITKVVFDSMPTTSLTFRSSKEPRYRATDGEVAAKEEAARWREKRQKLFENKGKPESYKFTISRGIADVIDTYAKNAVGKTMIDESLISTQEGLVVISVTGTISHQGEDINFPVGRPVFQYGDILQFLNNKMFTKEEAEALFEVMSLMSKSINEQLASGRKIKIDSDYSTFLQNLLYWRKSPDTSGNQIFVDTETMEFYFSGEGYDITDIASYKDEIVSKLQTVYNNVNNTTLTKSFSEPFVEYYLKDGALETREWDNYQSYLLSSKNPDGSARNVNNIPLTSSVREQNSLKPYNFKSKYAVLEGVEFPKVITKPATVAPVAPVVAPTAPVTTVTPTEVVEAAPAVSDEQKVIDFIGKRIQLSLPKGTVSKGPQTYKGIDSGEIIYTVTPEGQVAIDGTNPTNLATIKTVASKPASMAAINAALAPTPAPAQQASAPVVETKTETPASTDAKADRIIEAKFAQQETQFYIEVKGEKKDFLLTWSRNSNRPTLWGEKQPDGTYKPTLEYPSEKDVQDLVDKYVPKSLLNLINKWTEASKLPAGEVLDAQYKIAREIEAELAALEGVKPEETKAAAVIEVSKTYWTSSTPESIKEELIADTSKSITSDTEDEPGVTVRFAYNQANNETREVFVSGFEDAGEMDVVETLKGNYFSVESHYGSQDYHEKDPLLNEEIKLIINQNKKSERPPEPPPPKKTFGKAKNNRKKSDFMKVARVGEENARKLTDLEIQLLKEWHAENVPNIPYEVLEKLVSINSTERAYGVYEDGVAKFYKGGLNTSPYHELFHPIWQDFLSPDERQAIMDEFRAKIGSFTERSTGKKVDYSEATDEQIEERIADDFGDFRVGKLPARSLSERILKFFRLIIEFVKQFVRKSSQKEKLFNAINTGKYKGKKLSEKSVKKVVNPSYKQIGALTEQQAFEFVQDIAARWFQIVFETNRSLYDVENLAMGNVFDKIKDIYIEDEILDDSDADSLSTSEFNELVIRTKEFLRTFKIEFTEEDTISINDENRDKNEYAKEAFTTNWKTNSPFAIKLLMGTMTESVSSNGENENLDMPDSKENSFGGYKLLDFSRTFATAIDRFSNTTKATDLINKLVGLAASDNNYVRLFTRLGGSTKTKTIDFSQFKDHDWRLFVNFYQTFTRQKPDAIIQYITDENVYSGPANLFTSIKEVKRSWIENMRALAKDPESLLSYNSDEGTLQINDIKSLPIRSTQDKIDFLAKLGVIFPIEAYGRLQTKEQNNQVKEFGDAVSAIRTFLGSEPDIMTISGKTLTIDAQLSTLAELLIKVTNPNQDTSFFGLDKKRIQAYADNNAISVFENLFNSAKTLDDLLKNIRPELSDIFSAHSVVLKKGGLFFDKNGKRIKKIKVQYIQGTNKSSDKKEIVTSKLSIGDRFVQEMNQNINGSYYVLVPADSSTEWMMNLGNIIKFSDIQSGKAASKIYDVFIGYLKDDIAIARDNRTNLKSVEPRAKELRFFKDILPKDVLQKLNNLIAVQDSTDNDFKVFIDENIDKIHASIDSYINFMNDRTIDILKSNNQVILTGVDKKLNDVYSFKNLDDDFSKKEKLNKRKLDKFELNDIVKFTNVNYIINNIEFHKIMFGDPYQFGIKGNQLDETKRIKSFLSPRRTMFDTAEYNTFLNQEYNYVDGIPLTSKDPGYHLYKSYTKTVTLEDVNIVGSIAMLKNIPEEIQKKYKAEAKETDGVSWIMDNTYKEVKLKNGQWSPEAELWHQWQMAYTRQNLPGYEYTNDTLKDRDAALVSKPEPKFVIEVLKPVVTGNRNNTSRIELVLDKFSQMPVYYSMVEGTNLEKLYKKMFDAKVGYGVVLSGRKVGAEETHKLYIDGEFNSAPYTKDTIINVPWTSYGIQVENSYEGEKEQTRGSQITKLASIDLFNNGKGSDRAVQEYAENKKWLQLLHENGYNNLLKRLGIEDLGDSFRLINNVAVSETLEYELLRREMSTNAKDTVQLDKNKNFRIPFEASTAYIQIRDILFSMIDKAILSPKMNGGAHVQVPVTMFENLGDRQFAYNSPNGWVKISKAQYLELSDDEKKKTVLTDTTLKFYTRESPYCEVLLPHWFGEKFKSKFKTEKELLAYLNKPENSSILRGIGFRIPTQSLSSIEVFKVKGFLPKSMGSTVVVPSEIVTKAGSDFDIDKLNMYLKATYIDKNGDLRLVEHKGSEGETLEFYGKVFDDVLAGKKIKKAELFEAVDILTHEFDDPKNLLGKYGSLLDVLLEDYQQSEDLAADLMKDLEKLGDADTQSKLKNTFINNMYKKSLENAYYSSLERLVTLPENFDRLISPVDDAGLKKVSEDLDDITKVDDSSIPNRILDRNYMTSLRHSFIVAKKWVGIAAINITGQSLTQRAGTYIDPAMFDTLSEMDKRFIGDGSIALDHNTTEDGYVSIGGRKTADGTQYISDRLSGYATSFVDVAKDPYIMKIIKSELAVGTFMFLERIGVGKTTAMFMNQPIISKYLQYLDSMNMKGLFGKSAIDYIRMEFPTTEEELDNATLDVNDLKSNISTYYEKGYFKDSRDNAVQHLVLTEFLKYAKMAEFSFKLTQATNYDTSKMRSSGDLYRKQLKTEVANKSNIFSSAKKILDASFIGDQSERLSKLFEGMGEILKFDSYHFRNVINRVLKPYAMDDYLSGDNYSRIENKIIASFLDYIVQTKSGISSEIDKLMLIDNIDSTTVATRVAEMKIKYPEIGILDRISIQGSPIMEGGAKTVKLTVNNKESYDEDVNIGMFRELRDFNSETNSLYKDIVKLAILQGTYQSAVSIKNVIPIEDYSAIVAPIIAPLIVNADVQAFANGWFQRNNWKDSEVWKTIQPNFFIAKAWDEDAESVLPVGEDAFGNPIYQYLSLFAFPNIAGLNVKSGERKILILNETFNFLDVQEDFVIVPRVVVNKKTGVMVDMVTGKTVTDSMLSSARKKGNQIYKAVYGYQKVKHIDGTPVTYTSDYKGEEIVNHVYKLINLYGDSPLTTEYYTDFRRSVLNNNTMKIDSEIPDVNIIDYFAPQIRDQLSKSIVQEILTTEEATEAVSGEPRIGEITKNRDGSYNVMLFEGTSSDWKDNVLEVKILPNGKFQIVAMGMRELLKKDLEERFGKSIISKISSLVTQSVNESSEPISDERKAFIENRIRKLEQDIENGVAGPDTYSAIDAYRKELGITPNYEVTAANFESNVPDYTMAISNFYESLTPEQKATLGPIDDVIADYESIPFDSSYEDYIESLKCKL